MSEAKFAERQSDGSYRYPDTNPAVAQVVWGTHHFWAAKHGLLPHRAKLKEFLIAEFSLGLCVEEGGCDFRVFPEWAVKWAIPKLRNALEKEAERIRRTLN